MKSPPRLAKPFALPVLLVGVTLVALPALVKLPPFITLAHLVLGSLCLMATIVDMLGPRTRHLIDLIWCMRRRGDKEGL